MKRLTKKHEELIRATLSHYQLNPNLGSEGVIVDVEALLQEIDALRGEIVELRDEACREWDLRNGG